MTNSDANRDSNPTSEAPSEAVTAAGAPEIPPLARDPIRDPRTTARIRFPYEAINGIHEFLESEAYGAPRVFDMFTGLAIMLAWALVFALINLVKPLIGEQLPLVVLAVSCYIAMIGILQAVLLKGEKPRMASIVGGPPAWVLTGVIVLIANAAMVESYPMRTLILSVLGLLCSAPLGLLFGYLTGGFVAGVFLLADMIRGISSVRTDAPPEEDGDDAIFGEPAAKR